MSETNKLNIPDFQDLSNVKYSTLPNLPMLTFEDDGIEYSITDVRYCNSLLADTISVIFYWCNRDIEDGVYADVSDLSEPDVDILKTLVLSVRLDAKWGNGKRRRNSFSTRLVCGIKTIQSANGRILEFEMYKDTKLFISDYLDSVADASANWVEVCMAVIKRKIKQEEYDDRQNADL